MKEFRLNLVLSITIMFMMVLIGEVLYAVRVTMDVYPPFEAVFAITFIPWLILLGIVQILKR